MERHTLFELETLAKIIAARKREKRILDLAASGMDAKKAENEIKRIWASVEAAFMNTGDSPLDIDPGFFGA